MEVCLSSVIYLHNRVGIFHSKESSYAFVKSPLFTKWVHRFIPAIDSPSVRCPLSLQQVRPLDEGITRIRSTPSYCLLQALTM